MLRSIFFATGLFVVLWGVSFLFVDKVTLKVGNQAQLRQRGFRGMFSSRSAAKPKIIDPPDWAAFSLMSIGSVTMLYAVALPRKRPPGM